MLKKNIPIWFLVAITGFYGMIKGEQADFQNTLKLKEVAYRLEMRIDYQQQKLFGQCRLVLANNSENQLTRLPLVLYRLLKVTGVKDDQGNDLSYNQQATSFTDWEQFQANFIDVLLKKPLGPAENVALNVQYEGYLFGYAETGMLYVKDTIDEKYTIIRPDCLAYPRVGYPSWEAKRSAGRPNFSYQLRVTVPDPLLVANGGKLIGKETKDGWTTYEYRNIKPAWRIDAAIARYDTISDEEGKLKVFHFTEDKEGAVALMKAMKKVMALYSDWFGPLTGTEGFTVIEIPSDFGSQADVTCILQTADAFKSADQLFQLYHELSHLWDVSCNDAPPARFESEGLATFMQFLMRENLDGRADALNKGFDWACTSFSDDCQKNPEWVKIPMIDYGKKAVTDLSYAKGMAFYFLLYRLEGEKHFWGMIRSLVRKYHDHGVSYLEYLGHLKKHAKNDLTKFFQEWVFGWESSKLMMDKTPAEEILRRYRKNFKLTGPRLSSGGT